MSRLLAGVAAIALLYAITPAAAAPAAPGSVDPAQAPPAGSGTVEDSAEASAGRCASCQNDGRWHRT